MSEVRDVVETIRAKPVLEGAGVHLNRVFGHSELSRFDPFLLLDDFRGDDPSRYNPGFPMHPHRGIETVTYMLEGTVSHRDSLGNSGIIGPGDVQWMTAGRGILHEEMPHGNTSGRMYGFQLWANLPSRVKMMSPRYQEVRAADIPAAETRKGCRIRVIAGTAAGVTGPVRDIVTDPLYLDVALQAGVPFLQKVVPGHTVFAYVFEGEGLFGRNDGADVRAGNRTLVSFGRGSGSEISARSGPDGLRFLFVAGRPLGEPVAWGGPIVMNTREELSQAFRELDEGTFIRHG